MDAHQIQPYIDILNQNNLTALKIKDGDFHLYLERQPQAAAASQTATQPIAQPAEAAETQNGTVLTAPIIGTFYAAPSPDKPPFVEVGSSVKKGDVLFIIESMKLMNEIVSESDGTVTAIMIQNGAPVEFGTPILTIK